MIDFDILQTKFVLNEPSIWGHVSCFKKFGLNRLQNGQIDRQASKVNICM